MANGFRTSFVEPAAGPAGRRTLAGPVRPGGVSPDAVAAVHPLAPSDVTLTGGFWGARQQLNRAVTIPRGWANLEHTGVLDNLRNAAAISDGGHPELFRTKWFADSDVAKWLEAAAWERGRTESAQFAAWADHAVALIADAQLDDGYLNSYVQLGAGQQHRFEDLAWSHELYCLGHMMQAAVARYRATGEDDLLTVAVKAAELLGATFGDDAGRRQGIDGHPEIETALAELARTTGRRDILDTARYFVEAHGHGLTDPTEVHSAYYADLIPVRDARTIYGHAVRALYLQCGAVDVAVECGDRALLHASISAWESMVAEKSFLTGGAGSRWEGEAFGAPFELSPDRAYCETCAAQAVVQWSWRLLLATGDPRFADHIERTLYNAFAAGISLAGDEFFYVNTLQLRSESIAESERDPAKGRQGWFDCACCPPSIMRLTATLHAYVATRDESGLQLHQYAPGTVSAQLASGRLALEVDTGYPFDGRVTLRVTAAPADVVSLTLRIPAWCESARLRDGDVTSEPGAGNAVLTRRFAVGDVIVLDLDLPVRAVVADERIDAVRGQVAITRGPLVYCFEQADNDGVSIDDLHLDLHLEQRQGRPAHHAGWPSTAAGGGVVDDAVVESRPDLLGGTCTIDVRAGRRGSAQPTQARAVPYAVWANRGIGPMRVWTPVR